MTGSARRSALLRLRATPGGIRAYLVAKCVLVVVTALGTLALLLLTAAVFVDGPLPHGPGGWLTLLWVTTLGLLAVVPLGAAIGAVLYLLHYVNALIWRKIVISGGLLDFFLKEIFT